MSEKDQPPQEEPPGPVPPCAACGRASECLTDEGVALCRICLSLIARECA